MSLQTEDIEDQINELMEIAEEAVNLLEEEGRVREANKLNEAVDAVQKDPSKVNEFIKKLKSLKLPKEIENKLIRSAGKVKISFEKFFDVLKEHDEDGEKELEERKKYVVNTVCNFYRAVSSDINAGALFFDKAEDGMPAIQGYPVIKRILNNHLGEESEFSKCVRKSENKGHTVELFYKHLVKGLNNVLKEIYKRFKKSKNISVIEVSNIQKDCSKMFLEVLDLDRFLKKDNLKKSILNNVVSDSRYRTSYTNIEKTYKQLNSDCEDIYARMFL